MPLLNYTTSVAVPRTIDAIHKLLVKAGANQIATSYDDGIATGIGFTVATSFGPRQFLLPVNARPVEAILTREGVERRYRGPEHAQRVAWRIVKDWLEAQLALIQTEMVTLDQVMLPYMADESGRTVYEVYRDRQAALPAGGQ